MWNMYLCVCFEGNIVVFGITMEKLRFQYGMTRAKYRTAGTVLISLTHCVWIDLMLTIQHTLTDWFCFSEVCVVLQRQFVQFIACHKMCSLAEESGVCSRDSFSLLQGRTVTTFTWSKQCVAEAFLATADLWLNRRLNWIALWNEFASSQPFSLTARSDTNTAIGSVQRNAVARLVWVGSLKLTLTDNLSLSSTPLVFFVVLLRTIPEPIGFLLSTEYIFWILYIHYLSWNRKIDAQICHRIEAAVASTSLVRCGS